MNSKMIKALLGAMFMSAIVVQAADAKKAATPQPAIDAKSLFPDETLCTGKGVEIKRSQVDDAFVQFKANLTARGQVLPEAKRDLVESQLLDRLVITKLLVNRATDEDKKKARTAADKFVAGTKQQARSDESFQRQLGAMNFTSEQFDAQVLERAICEEVVDRELRSQVNITDEQLKKYYDENGEQFERPETVRAAHILLLTRDGVTGQEVSEETKKERRQQIDKILERANKGEEFAALAREYSEDAASKNAGGEYTFARGQFRNPEFESAAFALKTNEISGVITTAFGYHIIKLYEKMPAQKLELAKVKDDLKDGLSRREVQEKLLPDYLKNLKKEASLQYLNGAKLPPEASDEKPADSAVEKASEKPAAQSVTKPEPVPRAESATTVMGSTKAQVDALLSGWSSRESNRSKSSRGIYYYTKDVDMIVTFQGGRAVRVAVVDRPGAGVLGVKESRYQELLRLIGGGSPKPADVKRDTDGIREFYIGEVE